MKLKKGIFKVSGKSLSFPSNADFNSEEYRIEKRPGPWSVIEHLPSGERFRICGFKKADRLQLSVRGEIWNGQWVDSSSVQTEGAGGGSASDLEAQFPGKIRKILVKENQKVESGEPLLLVEAMKMEFSIAAPFAGVIKKIKVSEGQQIMPGVQYLDMEEEKKNE